VQIKSTILKHFKTDSDKNYVYVTKSKNNLDEVYNFISDEIDLEGTENNVHIYLTHPIGIREIVEMIDGVYADEGSTSEKHIKTHLFLKPEAFIVWLWDGNYA
jgi:hypothetical protein